MSIMTILLDIVIGVFLASFVRYLAQKLAKAYVDHREYREACQGAFPKLSSTTFEFRNEWIETTKPGDTTRTYQPGPRQFLCDNGVVTRQEFLQKLRLIVEMADRGELR